jgi:hypothetical protein
MRVIKTEEIAAYLPYSVMCITPKGVGTLERVKFGHKYEGYKLR